MRMDTRDFEGDRIPVYDLSLLYICLVWKIRNSEQPTLNVLITATNCQLTNYLSSLTPPVIQIPEPLFFVHRFLTKNSIKHMFLHMSPKKSWTSAFWGERVFAPFSEQVGYAIRIAIDVAFFCFSSVHQIKWYFFWMVRPGSDSLEPVYWKHELWVGSKTKYLHCAFVCKITIFSHHVSARGN